MKRFRYISFCITLLAQVLILVHNVIPHHHHDGGIEICTCHFDGHHNHSSDHDLHFCDSECDSHCTEFLNLFVNHSENIGSVEFALFSYITAEISPSDRFDDNRIKEQSEKCLSQFYSTSNTLRAPPILL